LVLFFKKERLSSKFVTPPIALGTPCSAVDYVIAILIYSYGGFENAGVSLPSLSKESAKARPKGGLFLFGSAGVASARSGAKVFWFFFSKKNCFLILPVDGL
jgi:hypothetical protein